MSKLNSAFITGAGGFIGRHLVRKLLQQAVEVTALMLPEEEVPAEWGEQVSIVIGDIRALKQATAALAPADCIFHLAAIVSDWGARQEHVDVTVGGTEQAIELALQWDAHFLVTTSVAAYASALAQGRLSESAELGKPSSHYEFCKQEQERVTLEAVQKRGLKATIVRPGNVFGVGSGPWMHTMLELINAGKPTLLGSGEWDAGLCHVNNLADLLILAARSDCTAGDIFNGADGFGVTWKTYLTRLAEVAGAPPPKSAPNWFVKIAAIAFETWANWRNQEERPMVTRLSYRLTGGPNVFDISAAKNRLGYQPAVNFEDAMAELAAHFGFSAATENPWVWVTGSASGLGRHLTGQLLQRGYRVLATDLEHTALSQAATEDMWPEKLVALEALDVTNLERWRELLEGYQSRGVVFSHLLNVAGIIRPGFSFENTAREMSLQLQVNTMGTINGCDALLPHFTDQGSGHFINIVSYAGFGPVPGVVGYTVSKSATRTFSNGLAMDLAIADSPIKVSCVCPDLIATPMMDLQTGYEDHSRIVFSGKRPLTTEEVSALVLGKVWEKQPMEVAIPALKAWMPRIGGLNPSLGLRGFRSLEAKGRENLARARNGQDHA